MFATSSLFSHLASAAVRPTYCGGSRTESQNEASRAGDAVKLESSKANKLAVSQQWALSFCSWPTPLHHSIRTYV